MYTIASHETEKEMIVPEMGRLARFCFENNTFGMNIN